MLGRGVVRATSRTACSLAVSASLTQSPGAFSRTLLRARRTASSTIAPPAARRAIGGREQRVEIEVESVTVARARRASCVEQLRRAGGDELAARVGSATTSSRPSASTTQRARLEAHEQAAEVVPRRVRAVG